MFWIREKQGLNIDQDTTTFIVTSEYNKEVDKLKKITQKATNIGILGDYGSGKSSLIATFIKNSKFKNKTIKVSLNNTLHSNDANEKYVETNILRQILLQEKSLKLPDSRIRRIPNGKVNKKFLYIFLLIIFFISSLVFISQGGEIQSIFYFIQLPFGLEFSLRPFYFDLYIKQYNLSLFNLSRLIALITIFVAIVKFTSDLLGKKIFRSFKYKDIEFSSEDNESIYHSLDEFMSEIIYFFSKTKYELIVFEDLDRLKDVNYNLFKKLYDINFILNNSKDKKLSKKKIIFMYAVKSTSFSNPLERSKYFDYAILLKQRNNLAKIEKDMIEIYDYKAKLKVFKKEFIYKYSELLPDMRSYISIRNIFDLNYTDMNSAEYTWVVANYMYIFPYDYEKIIKGKGLLAYIIQNKNKLQDHYVSIIGKQIDLSEKNVASQGDLILKYEDEIRKLIEKNIENSNIANVKIIGNILGDELTYNYIDIGYSYITKRESKISVKSNPKILEYQDRYRLFLNDQYSSSNQRIISLNQKIREIRGYSVSKIISEIGFEEFLEYYSGILSEFLEKYHDYNISNKEIKTFQLLSERELDKKIEKIIQLKEYFLTSNIRFLFQIINDDYVDENFIIKMKESIGDEDRKLVGMINRLEKVDWDDIVINKEKFNQNINIENLSHPNSLITQMFVYYANDQKYYNQYSKYLEAFQKLSGDDVNFGLTLIEDKKNNELINDLISVNESFFGLLLDKKEYSLLIDNFDFTKELSEYKINEIKKIKDHDKLVLDIENSNVHNNGLALLKIYNQKIRKIVGSNKSLFIYLESGLFEINKNNLIHINEVLNNNEKIFKIKSHLLDSKYGVTLEAIDQNLDQYLLSFIENTARDFAEDNEVLKDIILKMSNNQIELLIEKIGKIQFIDLNLDLGNEKLTTLIENNALILNANNLKYVQKKADNENLFLEKFTEYNIDLNKNADEYENFLSDIINASKTNNFSNVSNLLGRIRLTEISNVEFIYYVINNGLFEEKSAEILKKSGLDWNKIDKTNLKSILSNIDESTITDFLNLEMDNANIYFSYINENDILNIDYSQINTIRLTNLINNLEQNKLSFLVAKEIISNVKIEDKVEILVNLIKVINNEHINQILFDAYCFGENSCLNGLQVNRLDDSIKSVLLDIGYITNRTKKIK